VCAKKRNNRGVADSAGNIGTWGRMAILDNVNSLIVVKPPTFLNSEASVILDLIRGVAALLVLLEHWRNIFLVDYPQITYGRSLFAPLYLLCSAGHQAVIIFFVLSGYLISSSIFKMREQGTWSWKSYFTHRLLRLWIVLIPGLFLCALWDGIGLHLPEATKLYHGLSGNHMVGNVRTDYTVRNFIGNFTFLQTIRAHTFGSDGALWSLANEFWYYILFPLGLLSTTRKTHKGVRSLCIIAFIATACFVGRGIMQGFPIWLLGTVLALTSRTKLSNASRILAGIIYVPLLFWLGRASHLPGLTTDYVLAAVTFCMLWAMLSATAICKPSKLTNFSRAISRFSFTLYVVHTPLLVFIAALLLRDK